MKLADDVDLGQWWPYSTNGHAPEGLVRALASLAAGSPSAVYCLSEPAEPAGVLRWRLLAVAGQSLLEVQGTGPEQRSVERSFEQQPPTTLQVARCTRLVDAVVAVQVLATESANFPERDRIAPWTVTWALDLASGEQIVLPEEGRARSTRTLVAAAEDLAVAALRHLQAT